MGWSHHMRWPNTFDCQVRNSEKLILEIRTIKVAPVDLPPVYNHYVLSNWKSVSYHVMFTFQGGYKCNIRVVPCIAFSLFLMVSSCLMKRQWVVVHLFVPLIYQLSCRGDLVSQNNSIIKQHTVQRCCYLQLKAISVFTKILCISL